MDDVHPLVALASALERGGAPSLAVAVECLGTDAALDAAWASCCDPVVMIALLERTGTLDPQRLTEALAGTRLDLHRSGSAHRDPDGIRVRIDLHGERRDGRMFRNEVVISERVALDRNAARYIYREIVSRDAETYRLALQHAHCDAIRAAFRPPSVLLLRAMLAV